MRDNKSKNKTGSCGFNNQTKRIMKVYTGPLMKTFGNKTCFVSRDRAVRVAFYEKYPFSANHILRWRGSNEIPCTILKKCCKFIGHGLPPFNMLESLSYTTRFNISRERMGRVDVV